MAKYILQQAENINWMALFALITFMTVFIFSVTMVFINSKGYMQKMRNLPLDDADNKPIIQN
jgi:hypothetical protein